MKEGREKGNTPHLMHTKIIKQGSCSETSGASGVVWKARDGGKRRRRLGDHGEEEGEEEGRVCGLH